MKRTKLLPSFFLKKASQQIFKYFRFLYGKDKLQCSNITVVRLVCTSNIKYYIFLHKTRESKNVQMYTPCFFQIFSSVSQVCLIHVFFNNRFALPCGL
jgi:hypothetical protein